MLLPLHPPPHHVFVAPTRSNVNSALVFEYLFQTRRILKAYLGDELDDNSMRNNMTLIYELMNNDGLWLSAELRRGCVTIAHQPVEHQAAG